MLAKKDLQRDIELLCRDMDARFIQLEQRMVIKLVGLMVLAVGVVTTLVRLF